MGTNNDGDKPPTYRLNVDDFKNYDDSADKCATDSFCGGARFIGVVKGRNSANTKTQYVCHCYYDLPDPVVNRLALGQCSTVSVEDSKKMQVYFNEYSEADPGACFLS